MKFSKQIKPISYLKAHVSEVIRKIGEQQEPLIITQNGEAKAILQDIKSYEQQQESMALLKILALGNQQVEKGNVHEVSDAIQAISGRRKNKQRNDGG